MQRTKAQQIVIINSAYADIPELYDGFLSVRQRLFDMNEAAERRHRKGAPNGVSHGISVKLAARLFVCQYLLDGWAEPDRFSVDDITAIRNEVLYAQAYAKRFHKELATWTTNHAQAFVGVDYAELMKGGR